MACRAFWLAAGMLARGPHARGMPASSFENTCTPPHNSHYFYLTSLSRGASQLECRCPSDPKNIWDLRNSHEVAQSHGGMPVLSMRAGSE